MCVLCVFLLMLLFCFNKCMSVSLVVFHFGFEGGALVLVAPVPGHCLLVTCYQFIRPS